MIDRTRCMALVGPLKTISDFFNREFCQEPTTHTGDGNRLCALHAEELRQALRNPHTLGNVILGRARTEEEIALLVRELPS